MRVMKKEVLARAKRVFNKYGARARVPHDLGRARGQRVKSGLSPVRGEREDLCERRRARKRVYIPSEIS